MTEAGFLGVLIPDVYGGSGLGLTTAATILEEVHAAGCNAAALHAQMYTMGTILRHGSAAQKETWLPKIATGELRLQAFGVTEPTAGTDTTSITTTAVRQGDRYVVNGQKVWTSRAEHSDLMVLLARTTAKAQTARKTEGLSVFLIDMRQAVGHGLTIKPIRTMFNHATTEVFFDNLEIPSDSLIGEEGKGFRYILDGMNAERILISAECCGDARWFVERATAYAKERNVFGRPIGQNQGVALPHRARLRSVPGRSADDLPRRSPLRRGQALWRRRQHRQAFGVRGVLGGGRYLCADLWRVRFRRGVRRGAQVPRNPPLSSCAHLHQPDLVLSSRACAWPAAVLLSVANLDRGVSDAAAGRRACRGAGAGGRRAPGHLAPRRRRRAR